MAIEKPISQACVRNQGPILEVLKGHMKTPGYVVEIGCGTGQHAVHFARHLPHLHWQATDQASWLKGANSWIEEANLSNLPPALCLDVILSHWPVSDADYAYSANVLHYMPKAQGTVFFRGISEMLVSCGSLILYGPFNQQGYTSEGNARLDSWLKTDIHRDAGLWELSEVLELALEHGLTGEKDILMPANNHCLIFRKS